MEEKYEGFERRLNPSVSLRNWYAGMALQGIMGNSDYTDAFAINDSAAINIANHCYRLADAMILEGNK